MDFRNSKYIPYYVAGFIIILASVIIAFVIPSLNNISQPEVTLPPETTTIKIADGVPHYPDIPASTFAQEKFIIENGRAKYIDESVKTYTGVDVSKFQGNIDWQKVKNDGIDFAIIRVGLRGYGKSGEIYEDDNARKNIEKALAAGLRVGVYFFSQAITVEEAVEEAEFVLDFIRLQHHFPCCF